MKNGTMIALGIGSLFAFALAACGDDETSTSTTAATSSSSAASTGSGTGGDGTGGGGTGGGAGGSGGGSAGLEVKTHLSPDDFVVNSHLIVGTTDAILVDGQFFTAQAQTVVDMIKATGKNLTTVFLTHDHPDHFVGMDVIKTAFPSAQFVTTKAVLDHYNATKDATFMGVKMNFGNMVPDKIVDFTAVVGTTLDLEGNKIEIIELGEEGESAEAAVLSIASVAPSGKKALVAGDLVYNKAHLWTAECKLDGWKKNLDTVSAMGFEVVYPGHGVVADASVFAEDKKYLDEVKPILDMAASSNEAVMQIKMLYPTFTGDGLLNFATQNYFANCKP